MPKRLLSSEMLSDISLVEQGDATTVLFIGLILNADDYGLVQAHPAIVASKVWMLGQHDAKETADMLAVLVDRGFILPFESRGALYYALRSWFKWQTLSHPRALTVDVPLSIVAEMAHATKDPDRVYRAFKRDPAPSIVPANVAPAEEEVSGEVDAAIRF